MGRELPWVGSQPCESPGDFKTMGQPVFDLVVVGGGVGGLATAALAQRLGLRTALLEAHTRLGGCAGLLSAEALSRSMPGPRRSWV